MHGPWPEFCLYDYDLDRKKAYRYRMCGRFNVKIVILLGCSLLLLVVVVRMASHHDGHTASNSHGAKKKLTREQASAYELVATTFQPIWYDRKRGWNGTAYLQSYEFCATVETSPSEKRVPCPYVAYCPLGAGYAPSGGVKGEESGVQWAPVLDSENSWGEFLLSSS